MSNGRLYSGEEMLSFNGERLPYGILQFWRLNLSELILNVTRGTFAEFIVQCALDQGGFECMEQMKSGMEAWDLDGPPLTIGGKTSLSRIEVKSASSVQLNTPDEKEPISLDPKQLRFGIERKRDWLSEDPTPHHNNDLYVFCHYKATRKSDDILNLDFWEFYVFPTYRIREHKSLQKMKTMSVWRLNKLGVEPVSFSGLYDAIMQTIADVENHYNGLE